MIHRFILSLLVALTLIAVGCGEEEKKSSSDTGSTSGGSDSTSGSTSGTEDGTSSGTEDGTSSGTEDGTSSGTEDGTSSGTEDTSGAAPTTDLCQNDADLGYLSGTVADGKHAGKTGREAAAAAARTCGLKFIAAEDPKSETVECMTTDPENIALTDGCAGCYGDIVVCSITECTAPCAAGTPEECSACQDAAGCTAAFEECAGPLE